MDKDNGGSLEALLDDAAPVEQQQAPEPVATDPAPTGVDTVPPAEQTPSEPQHEAPLIPRAALEDERKKRQEREREAADYKRQLDEAMRLIEQAKQPKPMEEQPPDWLLEPDRAAQHQQMLFQRELFTTRVHISQEMMRASKPDYDEMETLFSEEAAKDPSLQQQLLTHPAPAKFAYEMGQRIKAFREIGNDPASYRAKIEQEILAKYGLAPNGQHAPAAAHQKAALNAPKSLASVPSAAPRDQQGRFTKAASIEDILGE